MTGVDIVAGQQLAIVVIGLAVGVAVVLVDGVDGGLQVVLVDVAGGDDLAVGLLQEGLGVARGPSCPSR